MTNPKTSPCLSCETLPAGERNQFKHYFFIPIFNEGRSVQVINHNIKTALKGILRPHFFISDNASTDSTFSGLLLIKHLNPTLVTLKKNDTNVGFAKNLLNIELLPPGSLVSMLGANDYLCQIGLQHMQQAVLTNPKSELFISNWAYYKNSGSSTRHRIYTGDIPKSFKANTLDEYFSNTDSAPNGIMQFTARREILLNIRPYSERNFKNPQLGLFMDSFPCKTMALGNPPLTEVKWIEIGGWRESKETVVLAHKQVADEMILLAKKAHKEGRMSREIARKVRRTYCRVAIASLFLDWGHWRSPVFKRPYVLMISSYTLNSTLNFGIITQLLFAGFLLAKRIVMLLVLLIRDPQLVYRGLRGTNVGKTY